jgi:LPXTG-site transpeptidase (sortase) family protein
VKQFRKPFVLIGLILIVVIGVSLFAVYRHRNQAGNTPSLSSPTTTPVLSPSPSQTPQGEYLLKIDKIHIVAPIIIDIDGANQEAYDKALEDGVAQLSGTALPGVAGNTFIFGHSSFYTGAKGDYKEVFKDLNDLIRGDIITIDHKGKILNYKVTSKQIVAPDRVDLISQDKTQKILMLMTCWPIGSDEKRLVIFAKLIN